jgi:hypothetical protein
MEQSCCFFWHHALLFFWISHKALKIIQQIIHWPDSAELTLSEAVTRDLQQQLLLPFASDSSAREFWQETYCSLIILDPSDDISDLKGVKLH